MFRISKRNRRKYSKVLSKLQPQDQKHYGASKRSLVKKDVWVEKPDNLYHYIVVSGDSILHLNQMRSSQTHVIEEMGDITCYLQQKKYFMDSNGNEVPEQTAVPMQQVCVLKMAEGSYNYFNKKFIAQNALIQVFQLPGHELTTKISLENATKVLDGKCDSVNFSFNDNKPKLKTQNLKAQVYTQSNRL
ncbi:MAG: hypothetical protein S4CHLAM6_11000 [Chlamydiae bacterium]|nr:hypothetical protein [Chlamydiota bacterium]